MTKKSSNATAEALSSADKAVASSDTNNFSVNTSRRRLAKFVVGTPVLVTIASRPVLAAGCLSNMMSGNLSDPNRGQCAKGWSPGGWGNPGGKVADFDTAVAWEKVGLQYGTYDPSVCAKDKGAGPNKNKAACYSGGATLANVPSSLNKGSLPNDTSLRDILNRPNDFDQLTRHFVCAYLNAKLSEALTPNFTYILATVQVLALADGSIGYPTIVDGKAISSVQEFLATTWD